MPKSESNIASSDQEQAGNQNEIIDSEEFNNDVVKKANLDRDIRKQHFFTIDPEEDLKMVKLKHYPKSSQLDAIFNQYQRIQQLKSSEEEVFLKLEDLQFQKERKFTISEVRALRKERNHKYYKYLIEVRKNFVSQELFSKFRKKVKIFSFDENANKEKLNENSIDESVEKESDVFSNYSEFY